MESVRFSVDRAAVPRPWDVPLAFTLRGEGRTVVAEIEAEAAALYRSEIRGAGVLLGQSVVDGIIGSVERAVVRRFMNGSLPSTGSVRLSYEELYAWRRKRERRS